VRKLALLALSLCFAQFAGAVEISSYDVTVRVAEDGFGKGVATVRLENAAPGPVAIPLGFTDVANVQLAAGPEGTTLSASPLNGHTLVGITLPEGTPGAVEVGFTFSAAKLFGDGDEQKPLPRGNKLLRLTCLNSQPMPIANYSARVVFPDGMRAHAIREALPKLGKSEAGPRVQLSAVDSKPGARIHVDRLLQGQSASMQIELVDDARSPGWLIAGLVLSVLYLVYFRDLVSPRAE
jgi:hypothetical protein